MNGRQERVRARGLASALVAALSISVPAGCRPPAPLDELTQAELCAGEEVELGVSPAPVRARRTGGDVTLAGAVRSSGDRLPGAWADFLEDLSLAEDEGAAFAVRFEGQEVLEAARERCKVALAEDQDAYLLVVRSKGEAIIAGAPEGQARGLASLRQLARLGSLPSLNVFDAPTVPMRFVLEGFYGLPWSPEARREMVRFAAAHRFDSYVYAPKMDLYSTLFWRSPYPAEVRVEARRLAQYARERGIELCWSIGPGHDIVYSDHTHREAMIAKLEDLSSLGVRCLILAFDDVAKKLQPPDQAVYSSYAQAQVDFMRSVSARVSQLPGPPGLAFVPTDYSNAMMAVGGSYAEEISQLDASIKFGWTGPEIVSLSVSEADLDYAIDRLGRAPVLGDNYPVRDAATASGPLLLRPIDGREPAIFSRLAAYGGNGMVHARASMVAMASLAELAWNPGAYQPERAQEQGLWSAAGGESPALRFIAEHAEGLNTGPDACAPRLRELARRTLAEPSLAEAELREHFRRMEGIGEELSGAHPRLLRELSPWVAKMRRFGVLGQTLLALRRGHPSGAPQAELEPVRAELAALRDEPASIADQPMVDFANSIIAAMEAP